MKKIIKAFSFGGSIKRDDSADAGYDIFMPDSENYCINPGETLVINTGLKLILPKDHYMQLATRSSTASLGVFVQGGVIDNGYSGEISVLLYNSNKKKVLLATEEIYDQFSCKDKIIKKGNKSFETDNEIVISNKKAIAQGILLKILDSSVENIDEEEFKKLEKDKNRKTRNGFSK